MMKGNIIFLLMAGAMVLWGGAGRGRPGIDRFRRGQPYQCLSGNRQAL